MLWRRGVLSLLAVVVAAVRSLLLSRLRLRVAGPLRFVSGRMKGFTQGLGGEPIEASDRKDEVSEIAHSCNVMSEGRVARDTELAVARRIPVGYVLEPMGLAGSGCTAYARERPAKRAGGGSYDLFGFDDGHVCIVVADVLGKGVSVALLKVARRTLLRDGLTTSDSACRRLERDQ